MTYSANLNQYVAPVRFEQWFISLRIQRLATSLSNCVMAGRRHKDFRSGDINEELGILLLKGVAAVASVSRPEDVGIDAIATLLRDGPEDFLIAESSFCVQFKSASIRLIEYRDHEVRWLEGLKLPFFIGRISRPEASIELFATHRLSQAILENKYHKIQLVLGSENKRYIGIDPETETMSSTERRVNIGPPLVKWSIPDVGTSIIADQIYPCLSKYLEAEQRNIEVRPLRYIDIIHWATGVPPQCDQGGMHFQGFSSVDILRVFRTMKPYLCALSLRAMMNQDRRLMEIVVELVRVMQHGGYDPDPMGIYALHLSKWDELTFPISSKITSPE